MDFSLRFLCFYIIDLKDFTWVIQIIPECSSRAQSLREIWKEFKGRVKVREANSHTSSDFIFVGEMYRPTLKIRKWPPREVGLQIID